MDIILDFLKIIFISLVLVFISTFGLIFIIQTIHFTIQCKNLFKTKHSLKWKLRHYLRHLRKVKYSLLIDFAKWVFIDTYRLRDRFKLFGLWCFTGYYGEGKTLGCLMFARSIKKKYPDYKIFTNFYCNFADGKLEKWEDLLSLPYKSIVIFDEIQSTFTSTSWSNFPIDLLWRLTQCRKMKLAIFASSPIYDRMSIQLRESTDNVVVCKNVLSLDRMFNYTFYKRDKYERYQEDPIRLRLNRMYSMYFTASDWDYKMYNTEQIVKRFDIDKVAVDKQKEDEKNKNLISDMLKQTIKYAK